MLFGSVSFAVFLPVVFGVYWSLQRGPLRLQNLWLLAASYVFYAWWDWRFLGLLVASSAADYGAGRALGTVSPPRRPFVLAASLAFNLGVLGFFKYFNFFIDSAIVVLESIGVAANPPLLRIVLPVGLSFYTFQSLSYTIDVYRGRLTASRDPVAFLAYVAFFPQLVAGPIERAAKLLPQFEARRAFRLDQAKDGMRQALWGFFKKLVVADTLAPLVNGVYANPEAQLAPTVVVATLLFGIQIYCDFSGYSDIAIGVARLFGFELMQNFAYPYFSRSLGEFWGRWHISLSTWFRDYVYIPLGGSRTGRVRLARNVLLTFLLSGLWHGANWTFVIWGALHALFYLPQALLGKTSAGAVVAEYRMLPTAGEAARVLGTFTLVTAAWVFFRAESVADAVTLLTRPWGVLDESWRLAAAAGWPVLAVLAMDWVHRRQPHALSIAAWPLPARWTIYYALVSAMVVAAPLTYEPFIYFQF